jgi:membrane associated rhomboid family serine protease
MAQQEYRPTSFQILPPVVKNLLIINFIFFLATNVFGKQLGLDLKDSLGLHYPSSEKFRLYQFITYIFMHGSFSHVFFNMFGVWMFGSALENFWGPKRFLIYYLLTGIGAAITHYVIFFFQIQPTLDVINQYIANPDLKVFEVLSRKLTGQDIYNLTSQSNVKEDVELSVRFMQDYKREFLNAPVVVGASGALFGLLLAFGMMFPNSLIYMYFFVPIKAKWFVVLYGAMELISGIMERPGDEVAHFAHLGGMLFGFFILMYWRWQRKRRMNDFL